MPINTLQVISKMSLSSKPPALVLNQNKQEREHKQTDNTAIQLSTVQNTLKRNL